MKTLRAFTLLELLVVMGIVALIAALLLPAVQSMRESSWRAVSTHSLQQLGMAGAVYRNEHDGEFWRYREDSKEGVTWWFGYESRSQASRPEGERELDVSRGPLGPYVIASGGVHTDPAFLREKSRHKPKFKNGNYGYGYNGLLGGGALGRGALPRAQRFERPAQIVVFATCAQVNTFQPPASEDRPMIEEFYLLDQREKTVHFRYGGKALASMLDGSIRAIPMDKGTLDDRMPSAQIGRFAPVGSRLYLWEESEESP